MGATDHSGVSVSVVVDVRRGCQHRIRAGLLAVVPSDKIPDSPTTQRSQALPQEIKQPANES